MITLDKLQSSDFLPFLHQFFKVRLDGEDVFDLELVSVAEFGPNSMQGARKPFSLQFLGPVSRQYLQQHTYCLEHANFGVLELFIVPLGPEAGRMRYEAIFS